MLKPWHTADARGCRVVVAVDDDSVTHQPPLPTRTLTATQLSQLSQIHSSFDSVLSGKLGSTSWYVLVDIAINTGDAPPFQSCPYRIPVMLVPLVCAEIDSMLATGVIEPSVSPWSSPIIPVKKKDGSIRVCIDFSRLNAVMVPDPYLLPCIDEIIDCLGIL